MMCLQQFQLTSFIQASLVAQTVKNLPAMQETWIQSLSWKDPLEELGNPLQYSCLADSMDRAVWWATVHVVAKNWTQLRDTHFQFQEWARCMEISQAFVLAASDFPCIIRTSFGPWAQ